ncbi:Hypothetical protein FKW44_001479 [Caligus rogercresseyi]|uniref:Uncharacterized protein n=1 Tax=Caligus rogercresseyi TaxID=217165 RepID=A0A7T8KJ45_CALRO|nr:Hypothetical protein FKW44_001479 [Caligus rogercresseyi]
MKEGTLLTDEDRRGVGLHSRSRGEGNVSLNGREEETRFLVSKAFIPESREDRRSDGGRKGSRDLQQV